MAFTPIGDIAVIGLAVMGQNLILNMADRGFVVVAYNRTVKKVEDFLENEAKGTTIIGAFSIHDLVTKLKRPRKILLLVKAGKAVDDLIEQLMPYLTDGDIIIDGGNSDYKDTQRRYKVLNERHILFVGTGISGGEEGARYGPSLMPGGHDEAWPYLEPIFHAISAKVNGIPCCHWVGSDGAGHFVKMVHNGIEYGDMQIISEIYAILLKFDLSPDEIADIFSEWNEDELNSFLIEITSNIIRYKDSDGSYLLPKILDVAEQKGTGKLTIMASLEYGVPVTIISEAVYSRFLSSLYDERQKASKSIIDLTQIRESGQKISERMISNLRDALYASKLVSYAQGFMLMKKAASINKWNLNYGNIAFMWKGGCIIRSKFLDEIKKAFDKNPDLENLLFSTFFIDEILMSEPGWRNVLKFAVDFNVAVPALSSALAFFDGYRTKKLPTNLIQAQRDYFGAHTYQLENNDNNLPIHTDWTGRGGKVSASSYQA